MLNNYFDNIYVLYINEDEINKIIPKLNKYNIKAQLYEGVNGRKEVKKYNEYLSKSKLSRTLTPGSFGHLSSLINILEDAIKQNYTNILMLEPDIYFSKNFNKEITNYLEMYKSMNYDIIYLGASQNKYYSENTWDTIEKNQKNNMKLGYYHAYKTLGTFAIGFNKRIFNKLLKELKTYTCPSDVSIVNIQNDTKCLVVYPNIICCDITKSLTSGDGITLNKNNQIMKMQQYKWILDYDIENTYVLNTKNNTWYEILIDINSLYPNYQIQIENKKINAKIVGVNKLKITHYSLHEKVRIIIANMFINDISIQIIQPISHISHISANKP